MTQPSTVDTRSDLPQPTTDLDRAKTDLDGYGYCLLEVLTPEQTAAARSQLVEVAAREREAGTATIESEGTVPGQSNQRVWQLLNRGEVFCELAAHPVVVELMSQVVGGHPPFGVAALADDLPQFLLSNIAANIACPGGQPQSLHADQMFVPAPWPPYSLVANVAWMLDDFTAANGATRVVPGSHKLGALPGPDAEARAIPVEGPAGTALIWEGRTWHGTGRNTTTDQHRHGILAYYCVPWLRQQENSTVSVKPEVLATASPVLRRLCGFDHYGSYGMVDGVHHSTHGRDLGG